MSQLQAKLPTDTWVNATWDEYLQAISDPACQEPQPKGMRLEREI